MAPLSLGPYSFGSTDYPRPRMQDQDGKTGYYEGFGKVVSIHPDNHVIQRDYVFIDIPTLQVRSMMHAT